MKLFHLLAAALLIAPSSRAFADTFTLTSPAGGTLPTGVGAIGGLVTDLVGINGVRVVAQLSASSEFKGNVPGYSGVSTPNVGYLLFAQQNGITPDIVAALGGGLASAAFRVTVYDGDTQNGNFDFNQDSLYVSAGAGVIGTKTTTSTGVAIGNFSSVATEETNGMGAKISTNGGPGFGNNILDTGFFSTPSANLASLYAQLVSASTSTKSIDFQLRDSTYGDQYYDFTQGIDSSLIDTTVPPIVTSVTPEPSSLLLLGTGLGALLPAFRSLKRRRA